MSLAGHLSRKMLECYSHTRNAAKRQAITVLDVRSAKLSGHEKDLLERAQKGDTT
jgi:hypothetical protein